MSKFKAIKRFATLTGVGIAAGVTSGHMTAQAGLQEPARKKGLKWGAIIGASAAVVPAGFKSKTVRAAVKAAGSVVFRRIRGRIIPVRVKK